MRVATSFAWIDETSIGIEWISDLFFFNLTHIRSAFSRAVAKVKLWVNELRLKPHEYVHAGYGHAIPFGMEINIYHIYRWL